MTYEELKAEAKRQGYKLIKDRPYVKFEPCTCGCNRRTTHYHYICGIRSVVYECNKCGKEAEGASEREAKLNWNRKMRDD